MLVHETQTIAFSLRQKLDRVHDAPPKRTTDHCP